ncbi:prepilin peptidase [Halothiobacillus sp. DCM-1]|uniref:prepilin peptidase n=1 Tax=Halothiobacillus sp. DCM-1 TaxID=3112558 RepID=UPI003252295B
MAGFDALVDAFRQNAGLWIGFSLILGLLIGSFLNVVIHRLPIMLERGWQRDCRELLGQTPETSAPVYNLITPRSACPQCHTAIKAWQNIPVLSWLWLRGRCAACGHPISLQYPLVELASGLLTALAAWHFGVSAFTLAVFVFGWLLLAAALIDLKTTLLPDLLTLPLMWLGLLLAAFGLNPSVSLHDAVLGAAGGYLALWSVYWLFKLTTGKDGMGYGDFKLLAALGAWLGWQSLAMILLLSAGVGAVIGVGMILLLRHDRRIPIPFGPYLAGAGFLALYLGDLLSQRLWGWAG